MTNDGATSREAAGERSDHERDDGDVTRARDTVTAGRHRAGEPARMPRTRRAGGLHQPEPVAVTWDERLRRPAAFVWRGRRHRIDRVVELWVIETGWWNDATRVSRSYSRVEAGGRLFDLCYDRLAKAWSLERTLN